MSGAKTWGLKPQTFALSTLLYEHRDAKSVHFNSLWNKFSNESNFNWHHPTPYTTYISLLRRNVSCFTAAPGRIEMRLQNAGIAGCSNDLWAISNCASLAKQLESISNMIAMNWIGLLWHRIQVVESRVKHGVSIPELKMSTNSL